MGPDLRLEDVSKSFGSTRAVDGVSLAVRRGEFFSLLGPSGCGKTTTLRLVAGFEQPDEGRIVIGGDEVTSTPPNKRRVNTVFQHYALFPHLTVEDNVRYGLKRSSLTRAEIADRLEEGLVTVRLQELRTRYPRELSGGQQQRVALARALVNQPTVLLLDEPLAALDLKLRKAMQAELKKLQERVGITFVYVTHDQEEALTLSDRIAVMNQGRVLQEGTPQEIYERPRTRFVADFIGETNFFEGEVQEVGSTVTVRTGWGAILRCAAADHATTGMHVAVAVRPESIVPANGSTPVANVADGVFLRRSYLGDLVQYQVQVAGTEVIVQRQNDRDDPAASWNPGDRVRIAWSDSDALVLLDDGAAIAGADDRRLVDPGMSG
ncbi:MAG: ABC transporter ATP-binding protein [Actinomycetota bacterium]